MNSYNPNNSMKSIGIASVVETAAVVIVAIAVVVIATTAAAAVQEALAISVCGTVQMARIWALNRTAVI